MAAHHRATELERELSVLQAQQSATANRLISRYRDGVERAAPRGTLCRDLYERALGRGPSAAPAPSPPPQPGPVALRTSTSPLLRIVVPVHGKWRYTRACLASIEAHRPAVPFEVLVVDDASPDRTAELVAASPGVRLVRTEGNVGFLRACKLAARHARGDYLLLLNNDKLLRGGDPGAPGAVRAPRRVRPALRARVLRGHRPGVRDPGGRVPDHRGTARSVKRYQNLNRAQFVDKWAPTLSDHLPVASELNVWLAHQRGPAGHRGGLCSSPITKYRPQTEASTTSPNRDAAHWMALDVLPFHA